MPQKIFHRYLIIGGTAYLIEMSALYIFHNVAGWSPLVSVSLSFWVGFISAFVMQKLITFRNYDKRPAALSRQLLFYSLLVAWNYGFTLLMVKVFQKSISVFAIRTAAIAIIVLWNYFLYKRLFADNKADA